MESLRSEIFYRNTASANVTEFTTPLGSFLSVSFLFSDGTVVGDVPAGDMSGRDNSVATFRRAFYPLRSLRRWRL